MTGTTGLDHPRLLEYFAARSRLDGDEVEFGDAALVIYSRDDLEAGQLGYSVAPNGADLTGPTAGEWQRNWLVIGREDLLGDPILIDLDTPKLEVFTAPHGAGDWKPERLADSADAFFATLGRIRQVAAGRLTADDALAAIAADSPGSSHTFWHDWLRSGDEE